MVIPCPNDAVASGHLPQVNLIGLPTSSISKLIFSKTPSFDKNKLNFFSPNCCAILTEPIFPERTKICSAVKSDGILLSYSRIGNPAQVSDFGKSKNSVSGFIIFSFKAAAIVKVLKTDPNS